MQNSGHLDYTLQKRYPFREEPLLRSNVRDTVEHLTANNLQDILLVVNRCLCWVIVYLPFVSSANMCDISVVRLLLVLGYLSCTVFCSLFGLNLIFVEVLSHRLRSETIYLFRPRVA